MVEADSTVAPDHSNASLATSQQIVGSYGATTTFMGYLDRGQVTAMQALSKWFYATAVGRVQTRLKWDTIYIKSGFDCLEIMTPSLRLVKKHRDVFFQLAIRNVQVGQKFFQQLKNRDCRMVSLETGEPLIENVDKVGFSCNMCNVQDQQIVALQILDLSCRRYLLARGVWEDQPRPDEHRLQFSMCSVRDWVYVIGGQVRDGPCNELMWRRQFKLDEPGADEWEKLTIPVTQLKPRMRPLLVPVQGSRIYVLGGYGKEGRVIKEVSMYEHETKKCQVATQEGPELMNDSWAVVVQNKLLIFWRNDLVTYDLETNSFTQRQLHY